MGKKQTINRRSFFSKCIQGFGVVGTIGMMDGKYPSIGIQTPSKEKGEIIYRTLGKTGLKMPVISMGVMNADIPDVVAKSYKQGVRHFDTAWTYQRGRNEEMVGDVIKTFGVRDKVSIATKIYIKDVTKGKTGAELKDIFLERFQQSLNRLKMDFVDILYLHNVDNTAQLNVPEIKDAFKQLQKNKKIRHIGFSTHSNMAEMVNEALKTDFWEVILVAYNFAMSDDEVLSKALQDASTKGIGLVGMKTQAGGSWWRQTAPNSDKLTKELNQTAMLKWVMRHQFITTSIPGYTNFQHMEEDFSVAYDLNYTPEEKKFLQDRDIKFSLGFCRQCKQCVHTCPKGVDIPTLMRVHMYMYQYHNVEHAYATYQGIHNGKNLNQCLICSACTVRCDNNIQVTQKMDALKNLSLS